MKILFALLPLLLAPQLLADDAKPNLDDPATRGKIVAQAIDEHELQKRGKEGEELAYAPNIQTPYTGWVKGMYDNVQVRVLYRYKGGQGVFKAKWHDNGQKWQEANYKDGKPHGLWAWWYENGQKMSETNYKDGKEHGLETHWDEEGKIWSETKWENGKDLSNRKGG